MSSSTNKAIADAEQARSHHRLDEERHATPTGDAQSHQPDERGRKIEREVTSRAKKK